MSSYKHGFEDGEREGFQKGRQEAQSQFLEMIDEIGVNKIQENLNTSFHGTFSDALKNGYDMNTHYVIVDWVFFHKLLKQEKEIKSQLTDATHRGDEK